MTATNLKLDAGFESNNTLLSHVINEIKSIASVVISLSPTNSLPWKKAAVNPNETQDTHIGDYLSRLESYKEILDDKMIATQPHHSNAAHHPLESAYNQHQNTIMNNSMDSDVGGGY